MITASGYAGEICLELSGTPEKTRITRLYSAGSWRIVRPIQTEAVYHFPIVGQSAGLKGGDCQRFLLSAHHGAQATLGPVAAEAVLPSASNTPGQQQITIDISQTARIYWATGATIPYPGSRLQKHAIIRRHQSEAWLGFEEFILGGRIGRREKFQNIGLNLSLVLQDSSGRPLCSDRLYVDPALGHAPWGPFDGLWSLWLLAPKTVTAPVADFIEQSSSFAGWVDIPHHAGILVKILGSYEELSTMARKIREIVSSQFFPTGNGQFIASNPRSGFVKAK